MFILYDLIFLIFAVLYLPFFFLRGKLHPGFEKRLGVLPKGLSLDRPIWVHAVSVGEAVSIRGLVEGLRRDFPGKQFVFSTVTPTGNTIVSSIASRSDFVTYLPLDLSCVVRSVFARVAPSALVIAETELWPNLIYWAARRKIPIVVVNGRISDSSFKWYKRVKLLLAPLLNRITVFCVQSERDGAKLAALGLAPGKIRVTGNMKFDIAVKELQAGAQEFRELRKSAGIGDAQKLLVAASTHRGEEALVVKTYTGLRKDFPQLRLLIAPRHPERTPEVEAAVAQAGLRPVRISSIAPGETGIFDGASGDEVFILDQVGRLMYFYMISDIVFIGGSLVKKGGHNILEPASLGKPVLFGPHMFNFRDIAAQFIEKNAAIPVADGRELAERIAQLLADPSRADASGAAARRIITDNAGATQRNGLILKELLSLNKV
jgi:3-deoxy-D-manno-octulosonic-acid transferase